MGVLYLAALVIGLGTVLVQLLMSGADGGSDGGGHAGADHGDAGQHADAAHPATVATIFLSVRFWTYAALAFGMLGAISHFFRLAGEGVTLVASGVLGLSSGTGATLAFRALSAAQTSSGAGTAELVGTVGRVLLPCSPSGQGKVRIEVRGQSADFLATTDESDLEVGALVLVLEVRGQVVHVSRAPEELSSPRLTS